jgi:Xaa-Pro aminopeptidase
MTRTVFVGKIDDDYKKAYDIVLAAQLAAISCIKAGVSGQLADSYAREIIEGAGYVGLFGHGLGHGLGLEVHEAPRLGINSTDILDENMVFTIEPGLYMRGRAGIRVEDTVVLQNGKILSLNKSEKTLLCI